MSSRNLTVRIDADLADRVAKLSEATRLSQSQILSWGAEVACDLAASFNSQIPIPPSALMWKFRPKANQTTNQLRS